VGEAFILIQQGEPVVASSTVTFLGAGSAGTAGASRRLVFPSSVTPLLAPLVYSVGPDGVCLNPSSTFNLDNEVLPHPITSTVQTLGTTKAIRFESNLDDVIVTEIWEAGRGGSSMPTSFFRLLYEYLINAALVDAVDGPFIQWEPRDRTDKVYNVEILSLAVGSGRGEEQFNVRDVRESPGVALTYDGALSTLSPVPTGLIDEDVTLRMKIISEAI